LLFEHAPPLRHGLVEHGALDRNETKVKF